MQTECLLLIEDLQRLDNKAFLDETKRQWIAEEEARLLATPTKSTGAAFRNYGRPTILAVAKNSPAHKAGLQAGDVITALNGRQISSVADLTIQLAATTSKNQAIKFAVRRTAQTIHKKVIPWRGHAAWTFPSLLSGKNAFFEQLALATVLGPRHQCGIAYPDLKDALDSSFNEFIKINTAHYSIDEWRAMEPLAMQGELTKKQCEEYKEALSSTRFDDLISESREEALRSEKIEQIIELNGEERSGIGIRLLSNRKESVIEHVSPSSSASSAGLQVGDVIVDMNGSRVASASDLVLRILLTPPGKEIVLSIFRGNSPMRVVVQVETIN
jgi:predicted metalloprotease with PDZ domain